MFFSKENVSMKKLKIIVAHLDSKLVSWKMQVLLKSTWIAAVVFCINYTKLVAMYQYFVLPTFIIQSLKAFHSKHTPLLFLLPCPQSRCEKWNPHISPTKAQKRSVSLFPKVLSKNTPIVWSSFPQLLQSKQLN